MFNNPAIHPCTEYFIKDTLELFSDYLCIHSENEQPPIARCFRNIGADSLKISYTKNKRLNPIIFRKDSNLVSYKKNPLRRESSVNSVWLVSHTQHHLKDIEATAKSLNMNSKLQGVQ